MEFSIVEDTYQENEAIKTLRCRDMGFNCEHEIRAETVEDVLQQTAQHAMEERGLTEATPEIVEAVKAQIRDE
jgi:predicted small metal-binding protein